MCLLETSTSKLTVLGSSNSKAHQINKENTIMAAEVLTLMAHHQKSKGWRQTRNQGEVVSVIARYLAECAVVEHSASTLLPALVLRPSLFLLQYEQDKFVMSPTHSCPLIPPWDQSVHWPCVWIFIRIGGWVISTFWQLTVTLCSHPSSWCCPLSCCCGVFTYLAYLCILQDQLSLSCFDFPLKPNSSYFPSQRSGWHRWLIKRSPSVQEEIATDHCWVSSSSWMRFLTSDGLSGNFLHPIIFLPLLHALLQPSCLPRLYLLSFVLSNSLL